MPILKMLTGLSGPDYSLVRDDEHEFDEREASSLIRAGFAVATDDFEPIPLDDGTADTDTPVIDADAKPAAEDAAAAKKAEDEAAAEKAEAAAKAAPAPAKRKG